MFAILGFLALGCNLHTVHTAGKGSPSCSFPFIFDGKSYSSCTKDGAIDEQLWCSTTPNYDKDGQWKPCSLQEYGGNSGGKPCIFPFIYKNRTFYTCTDEEKGVFWCATTRNYDKDLEWSCCADTRLDANPKGPCVFPFTYNHTSYSACTTDGISNKKPWCSLTDNYDTDMKWTYCEPSGPAPASENPLCVFPFIYKGKSYSTCTSEGMSDGKLWCANTSNFDVDKKWVYCTVTEAAAEPKDLCAFPFMYNGKLYDSCTTHGMSQKKPWCSLTADYNADLQWTYCEPSGPDEVAESPPCIFPFIFKRQFYHKCTTDGRRDKKPWCATTGDYDTDKKLKLCPEEPGPDLKVESPSCSFPFIYKGNSYSTCTTEGMSDGKHWCATTSNYDTDEKWMYCNVTGPVPELESPTCVFPFIYKGLSYSTCTLEGMSDGKLWCATTSNYDVDKKWVYCNVTGPDSNGEGPFCVFPFIYNGKSYSACTTDGMSDGKCWCATTSNYDSDKKWMYCNDTGPDPELESPTCVLPFIYKGQYYSTCTSEGMSDGKFWCATTSNHDVDKKWVYCNVTGPDENVESPPCVFPFIYKGKFYHSCTADGRSDGSLWCATTSSYDVDKKWKFCEEDSGPDPELESPTCVFPFIYKGQSYSTCTSEGMSDGKLWCATTSNYDVDKKWVYCNVTGPDISEGTPKCAFPFIFEGKLYMQCISSGQSDGRLWCSTTSNFDVDKKWKFCEEDLGPDLKVESPSCSFPFIYKGQSYSTCTTEGMSNGKHWCATTSNYDTDEKWMFCNVTGPEKSKEAAKCIFPFIFDGKNYSSCTEVGRTDGKLWCSTTANYDVDKKSMFCTITETGCVFPFIYKGKPYESCTTLDKHEGKAWCATTPDYQTGLKWRFCNQLDCVFPFIFRGKSYHSCTKEGRSDKRSWCSLTSNADTDNRWILC